MPTLFICSSRTFHPRYTTSHSAKAPPEERFTREFGRNMRDRVLPELFQERWGEAVPAVKIGLVELELASSVNMPDLWVIVRPLFKASRAEALGQMLEGLAEETARLRDQLVIEIGVTSLQQPTLDVEVDFKFGGGVKLGREGEKRGSWQSEFPVAMLTAAAAAA